MKLSLSRGGVITLGLSLLLGIASTVLSRRAVVNASAVVAPRFEVDPFWPKPLPNHWILGQSIGVSVDAKDHIWMIHRQASLEPGEVHATTNPPISSCCAPAPAVLEFDTEGNLIGHWGGPGPGYNWPASNHGITVDYKGNVWIGGNGRAAGSRGSASDEDAPARGGAAASRLPSDEQPGPSNNFHDNQVLKFTQEGKFLLQIGRPNQSRGSNDPDNLKGPAQIFVDPKTNEAYVSDGYGNHRVIVFDADTGKYKRHWGAYGNKPDDATPAAYKPTDPPAQQFRNPVHCVQIANDGLVYVCDRQNDRIQVFHTDGTFVKEAFVNKETLGSGSAWELTFSRDPQQKFVYLTDGENDRIHILERDSLKVLTTFGEGGRQPGEFYGVHSIATDSKGNLYTAETYRGQRIQKFIYKGLAPVPSEDQRVLWPKNAAK